MTAMIAPTDLAYAAALVDNHARLGTRTVGGTELPVATIQGKILALDWLADLTSIGLTRVPKAYNRHQCTDHCPAAHARIESVSTRWSVTGSRATVVLHNLAPYMRVQAADARALVDLGVRAGFKGNVTRNLVSLGWTAPEEFG